MKWMLLATCLVPLSFGCAHHRAEVAMKVSDREAHVGLGSEEVQPGDKVILYKKECRKGPVARGVNGGPGCIDVPLGEGTIVRNLNKNYSVVKVDPGVTFKEGTLVKKEPKMGH